MSYDITLVKIKRKVKADVGNYTSNVSQMWATALGCSLSELHGMPASECIPSLETAVADMEAFPHKYLPMNPDNGWGNYQGALEYLQTLLIACKKHQNTIIDISC